MISFHPRQSLVVLSSAVLILGGLVTLSSSMAGAVGRNSSFDARSGVRARPLAVPATSKVLFECESDGATISVAMAAFHEKNPRVTVTQSRLLSRHGGGPFLKGWSYNEPFYAYSINARGKLEIQIPAYGSKLTFVGPTSCNRLKSVTPANLQVVEACEADGATIATAIAAFRAQHPGLMVTQSRLLGPSLGGPYLQGWARNPPHYAYRVNAKGVLQVAIPANGRWATFVGSDSCSKLVAS